MTSAGLYVPMITPFDESGAIALDALRALAQEVLTAGAAGLVALGTTAEAHAAPELRALAGRPEVTAALCLVPPFLRPGEEAVLAHYTRLAEESPVPLVAYHVPYRTGQQLGADTLRRLARLPGLVGVKHAVGASTPTRSPCWPTRPPTSRCSAARTRTSHRCSPSARPAAHPRLRPSRHRRLRRPGHGLAIRRRRKAVLHAQGRIPTPLVRPPLLPATPAATARALTCLAGVPDEPA